MLLQPDNKISAYMTASTSISTNNEQTPQPDIPASDFSETPTTVLAADDINHQPTIGAAFDSINGYKPHVSKTHEITQEMIRMLVGCNLPYSLVDKPQFRRFMKFLKRQYVVPCRNTIKQGVFDLYESKFRIMKERLKSVSAVSITADIWTTKFTTQSFMGLSTILLIFSSRALP